MQIEAEMKVGANKNEHNSQRKTYFISEYRETVQNSVSVTFMIALLWQVF
jgi:hypothetical protein